MKELTDHEKILMTELENHLISLKETDGFWIRISVKKGKLLHHYQVQMQFPKEDLEVSLNEMRKLVGIHPKNEGFKLMTGVRRFH